MKITNKRIGELDALRGLAALAVVIYHYSTRYGEEYGHIKNSYFLDFPIGKLGVHLFFIISGFVIYMTLVNAKTIKEFAIKRCIRLYPAYIFAVILTFIFLSIFGLPGREISLQHAIFNLTMLQGFLPGIPEVDGAYWSLTVEITFYIIIATFMKLGLHKKIVAFSIIWLILSAIIRVCNLVVASRITELAVKFSIAEYSHLFIAGIMFYQLKQNKQLSSYLIIAACLVFQLTFESVTSGIIVIIFFATFYLLIANKLHFLEIRGLSFLGSISYSLYLLHQNIGYIIIRSLENAGLVHEIFIIVPIIFSIIIASLVTFLVEKPIQKLLSTIYKRTKTKKGNNITIPT